MCEALKQDKVAHAYLFSGPKGSGKTTTARLLAKAVNCEKREKHKAEPCNRCRHCREIDAGGNLDILEIDAASHRGIEEIRELKEAVKFAPARTKRKVFIIDEVHMLTREAFNALLKTLEEPPAHALFIMATTEPHKVPATIVSRSQHFRFKRAGIPELVVYLVRIAKAEKISIEEDALKLLASTADGSFRDAASALEQVWAAHPKSRITADQVQKILGLADRMLVVDFLSSLAARDQVAGMQTIGVVAEQNLDVGVFIKHSLEMLRGLLLLLISGKAPLESRYTVQELQQLEELKKYWGPKEAVRLMEDLIAARELVRVSPMPELPLEMLVAEWASERNNELTSKPVISERADEKARQPGNWSADQAVNSSMTPVPVAKEIERVDNNIWESILSEIREVNTSLYSILKEAIVLGQTTDGLALGVRFRFHGELLSQPRHQAVLSAVVSKALGRPASIIVEVKPEAFTKQEEELLKMAEELL